MYILSGDKKGIINSEFCERFMVVVKPDAALIIGTYNDARNPVTISRYADEREAMQTLGDLYGALANGAAYYTMPESSLYATEAWKRDARTKRKGGS